MKTLRTALSSLLYWLAGRVEYHDRADFGRMLLAVYESAEHCHTVRPTHMPATCERCGRGIVVGFRVLREVWRAAAGDAVSLCLGCFDDAARAAHVRYHVGDLFLVPWYDTPDE